MKALLLRALRWWLDIPPPVVDPVSPGHDAMLSRAEQEKAAAAAAYLTWVRSL